MSADNPADTPAPTVPPDSFAGRLVQLMDERELSGVELGKLVGVPPATVSHWRGGDRQPGRKNLARLAKALDVSQGWLLYGEGRNDAAPAGQQPAGASAEPSADARKAAENTVEYWVGHQAATAKLLRSAAAVQDASSAMLKEASDMLAEAIAAHAAIMAHTLPVPISSAALTDEERTRAERGEAFLREIEERRARAEARAREEEERRRRKDAG